MGRIRDAVLLGLVPPLAHGYIRLLHATMRIDYRGREVLERIRRSHGHYILAFWHSRFLMMPYVYPGGRITVLSSTHRDAEILGKILVRFGLDLSRGSSTRGGVQGMRDILRKVRDGYDVGITPDGPKGPRRRVKAGVVATARLTGLPIVPVVFSARPARRLRSWDGTLVPRPFARGIFVYGEPIEVPRDLDEAGEGAYRNRLEEALDRLTDAADVDTGIGPEPPKPPASS